MQETILIALGGFQNKPEGGPKMEAATRFVRWKNREAVIGSLDRVLEAPAGTSGTRIVPGR